MPDEVVDHATAEPDDAAIEAEVAELTASPSEQQADKVRNALIAAKREGRAQKRRIAELEPVAARVTDLNSQLERVTPILSAVNANPKLLAEAMRIANGTAPSRESTAQPTDDADANAMAEDLGFYMSDGVTPDAARGKRVLDRMGGMSRRQAEDVVRPWAGVTLGDRADQNLRAAMAKTDDDGVPWASPESIREVADQLPAELKASPAVVKLLLNAAVGIDKEKGRTPKAPTEPIYMAQSSGRRVAAQSISPEERRAMTAVGLTEADFKRSIDKLEKAGGKAVNLGGNS